MVSFHYTNRLWLDAQISSEIRWREGALAIWIHGLILAMAYNNEATGYLFANCRHDTTLFVNDTFTIPKVHH